MGVRSQQSQQHGDLKMTIEIQSITCKSASGAIQEAEAGGFGEAVLIDGRPMVVPQRDIDRLAESGAEFAYLYDRAMPDGSHHIVAEPVN